LQELKNRLLFVEMAVQQNDLALNESRRAQAFQVAAHSGRRRNQGNVRVKKGSQYARKNGACHNCGKYGLWKKECPQKKDSGPYKRQGHEHGPSVAFVAIQSESIQSHSDTSEHVSPISMQLRSGTITQDILDESSLQSSKDFSMPRMT
jgi:hypothetical protein